MKTFSLRIAVLVVSALQSWNAADGDLVYEQQRFRERRLRPDSSGRLEPGRAVTEV
jgi:hypothetical protein